MRNKLKKKKGIPSDPGFVMNKYLSNFFFGELLTLRMNWPHQVLARGVSVPTRYLLLALFTMEIPGTKMPPTNVVLGGSTLARPIGSHLTFYRTRLDSTLSSLNFVSVKFGYRNRWLGPYLPSVIGGCIVYP